MGLKPSRTLNLDYQQLYVLVTLVRIDNGYFPFAFK
jgi:hypothetical protein